MEQLILLSDIHGNLEALNEVIKDFGKDKFMRRNKIFLGDYVDFGPCPNECIDYIRAMPNSSYILGNHDTYINDDTNTLALEYFKRKDLAEHTIWTREQLSLENRMWLKSLPREYKTTFANYKLKALHADTQSIEKGFVPDHAKDVEEDIIVCGHIHCPYKKTIGNKTVINPGSIGESLDGDNRASYAYLTIKDEELVITHRRVSYDLDAVYRTMEEKNMPLREEFITTMKNGCFRI